MNNLSKILSGALVLSLSFNGIWAYNTTKEFDKKDKKISCDCIGKRETNWRFKK